MRTSVVMLGAAFCGLWVTCKEAQGQPAPRAVELYALDGISYAVDVNNSGQVVGVSFSGPPSVWHYGDVAVIDAPQGVSSASAINARWQRHHSASAHMIAVGCSAQNATRRS